HEAAARVEILTHKHAVRAESTFGEEWVRTRQRSGGVLVAWEAEPARRGQCRRAGFTGGREVAGVATVSTFSIRARFGSRRPCLAYFRVESLLGSPAGF